MADSLSSNSIESNRPLIHVANVALPPITQRVTEEQLAAAARAQAYRIERMKLQFAAISADTPAADSKGAPSAA